MRAMHRFAWTMKRTRDLMRERPGVCSGADGGGQMLREELKQKGGPSAQDAKGTTSSFARQ